MLKTNRVGTGQTGEIRVPSDTLLIYYERTDCFFNSLSATYTSCGHIFRIATHATHYIFLLVVLLFKMMFLNSDLTHDSLPTTAPHKHLFFIPATFLTS